ncbi:MAG: zinc-binding dehydrogenase [Candidatus Dormibacteria bacterium]
MRAVIKPSRAPGFVVGDVPEPRPPGRGQVLLRVVAASVCGSDVHLHDWNPWAAARVHPPRVMGHEICGEVVATGDGVDLAAGVRVATESHLVCGVCPACRRGDTHVCPNTRILGVDVDGGFTDFLVVPQENVIPVGGALAPYVASALEPVGNAVHACSRGELEGRRVAVFGCGPIGCAAVAIARAEGAEVVAIDRNAYRLELAERMGAHHLVIAADDVEDAVRRAAGDTVDCALEMSGAPAAVVAATRVVRPGGWISLLGIGDSPTTLDLSNDVVMKGITLHGVVGRRVPQTWEQTLGYVNSGAIDVAALITHHFPIGEIDAAIALMKSGQCGKVALRPFWEG